MRSRVSNRRSERQLKICSRLDQEPMSLDNLLAAERLFAGLAVRWLLDQAPDPEFAGPRLHPRAGRELTPQEGGPAEGESEHDPRNPRS